MRAGAADAAGEKRHEAGVGVPTADEGELRAVTERPLELVAVTRDREARIVRSENEADDALGARLDRPGGGVRNPRRPVLHAGQDGHAELLLEGRTRLLRDRVQRVRAL